MTGEVKIEKECVKMTHRSFFLFLLGVISLAAISVTGYLEIVHSQKEILSAVRVIVGTCCPDDTKRFFDGYKLGFADDNNNR